MKVLLRDGNKSILFLTSYRLHMNGYTDSLRYYTFLSLSVRKTFTQVINVLLRSNRNYTFHVIIVVLNLPVVINSTFFRGIYPILILLLNSHFLYQ